MENRIENLLRMFNAVLQYLKQNPAAWPENEPVGVVLEEMAIRVGQVESTRQMVDTDQSGVTREKTAFKAELTEATLALASVIYAMAVRTNNLLLQGKTNLRESDLTRLSEAGLATVAKNVLDLANENLDQLAPYQVTAETVANQETILKNYKDSLAIPRATVAERKAANEKIKTLVKQTSQLLDSQLDRLMMPYKKTNPDFYHGYKNARKIVDYGIRHEKPEDPETPAPGV